jgi:hypothetical protein
MSYQRIRLLTIAIIVTLVGLALIFLLAILFPRVFPSWLGTSPLLNDQGEVIYPGKSIWDLVQLLIVPLMLAVVAYMFNSTQAQRERELAERRNQEEVLETFIHNMSELILEHDLMHAGQKSPTGILARTMIRTSVYRVSPAKKSAMVRFLKEAGLIDGPESVVSVAGCDFREARLGKMNLASTNLANANLMNAVLRETSGSMANFTEANLSSADLEGADLRDSKFVRANLAGANLRGANLEGGKLVKADLRDANLMSANLRGDLTGARLEGARFNENTLWPEGFAVEECGAVRVD